MRALAGLLILAVAAAAGLGTYAGPEVFASMLERGFAGFAPKPAEAAADKPAAQGPVAIPAAPQRQVRIITQTVAVSDAPEATAAASASPPVTQAVIPPSPLVKVHRPMISEKKPGYKLACAAGQRLDRARHKCVPTRHSDADQMPKPLG